MASPLVASAWLSPALMGRLQRQARQLNWPVSRVVRAAVAQYLDERVAAEGDAAVPALDREVLRYLVSLRALVVRLAALSLDEAQVRAVVAAIDLETPARLEQVLASLAQEAAQTADPVHEQQP